MILVLPNWRAPERRRSEIIALAPHKQSTPGDERRQEGDNTGQAVLQPSEEDVLRMPTTKAPATATDDGA
jgi:hypothetical protein